MQITTVNNTNRIAATPKINAIPITIAPSAGLLNKQVIPNTNVMIAAIARTTPEIANPIKQPIQLRIAPKIENKIGTHTGDVSMAIMITTAVVVESLLLVVCDEDDVFALP